MNRTARLAPHLPLLPCLTLLGVVLLAQSAPELPAAGPPRTGIPTLAEFQRVYPSKRVIPNMELFKQIGGGFLSIKPGSTYENSCAIRISRALLLLGYKIPARGYNTLIGGHGERYIFRSLELKRYLEQKELFGPPARYSGRDPALEGKPGIVVIQANFKDNQSRTISTAHIDVWTGSNCTSQDCSSYFNYGGAPVPVFFWELK